MKVQWGLYTSDLFSALLKTLEYTVLGFVGAVLLGLALALMRRSQTRVVRLPAGIYTELFKNIPLLAIIFITYFGLGSIGLRLSALAAGALSLVIFYAAYLSEIFRAALGGVPPGQQEGAQALGMSRMRSFRQVIMPQALRLALPGTATMGVDLLKSTSLLVTIAAGELMSQAQLLRRVLSAVPAAAAARTQGARRNAPDARASSPGPQDQGTARGRCGRVSALIEIRKLSKSFGPATVLHSVDVDVQAGQILTILGQSGGGKSTLLRCINLLEIPSGGDITIAGDPVVSDGRVVVRDLARLRQKVGMVFQRFNLFPHLTAIENVILAQTKAAGISEDQAIETAVRLIRRVGLAHRAMAFPDQMSGGEQQRVAIARALALKPTALLFDEPTSALDPESTREVLTVMRELAEGGMTMVIVTHEVPFAQQISDQVAFVDAGYIVEQGPPSEVIGAPRELRTQAFLNATSHA